MPAPPSDTPPTVEPNAVLAAMLDRLYAALMRGPGLNCRPGNSRQRIDLTDLSACDDAPAADVFQQLLEPSATAFVSFNVPRPDDYQVFSRFRKTKPKPSAEERSDEASDSSLDKPKESPELRAYRQQQKLAKKFRNIIDDARTYQQDTGVHALSLGYPILSVPPGVMGSGRILAPVAFVPVSLTLKAGGRPGLELSCYAADADRVVVNPALMAWLERNTGAAVPDELFDDEAGEEPWREIKELIKFVAQAMRLDDIEPESFLPPSQHPKPNAEERTSGGDEASDQTPAEKNAEQESKEQQPAPPPFTLTPCPNADGLPDKPALLRSAVLGLFPAGNQGLIRDTRAMLAQPQDLEGPVLPFVSRTAVIEPPQADQDDTPDNESETAEGDTSTAGREAEISEDHDNPRPVALADPCQLRAVTLSRTHRALVLHGPPGTGKSQTITNIIGDHLARGQRVLFVCDKRTALDVVAHRLDSLGLSPLCAVVHDPQRDRRDLYMGLRAQLDRLTDAKTHPRAEKRLEQIDQELDTIHTELTALHDALMQRRDDRPGVAAESFHELVGRWLAIDAPALPATQLTNITLDDLETHRRHVELALERGNAIVFPTHPWSAAAQGPLETYLSQPVDELRRKLASSVEDARAADATADPDIPPFNADEPLPDQAARRAAVLDHLRWIDEHPDDTRRRHAASLDADSLPRMLDKLGDAKPWRDAVDAGPLDAELWLSTKADVPTPRVLAEQLGTLEQYLDTTTKWYGFLCFGAKSRAAKVLRTYGLKRTPDDATRLRDFLAGVRARVLLSAAAETLAGQTPTADVWPDEQLASTFAQFDHLLPALQRTDDDRSLRERLRQSLLEDSVRQCLLAGLAASPPRSDALQTLEQSLQTTGLFNPTWQQHATAAFRAFIPKPSVESRNDEASDQPESSQTSENQGKPTTPTLTRLRDRFDDLETVLRIQASLDALPQQLREATANLLEAAAEPGEGVAALSKRIIEHTLSARVAADPSLSRLDPAAVDHAFARHAELEKERREKTTDAILHRWTELQRQRLLVGTGTKLNSLGAAVRQRLYIRGKRAMRLRQVISVGQNTSYDDAGSGGGDPIFDLAPIWLASPETVAQCFPREDLFDVVVFDEASQCRLEEALPVLTRAKRVVIAGDPKQLPPTRFFEAALASSDDVEIRDEDDLFEAQQTEVEDLLAAALNLDVQESYLDVHYRSRNADLIEFSNDYFYKGRLQAIPGHPRNISRFAPLTLHRADGVYEDRVNPDEAAHVVQLVDDLLKRAEPPSIGIACFNLAQRDLIAEALDDHALEDDDFAKRLDKARNRDGESSFEGLFVKNLENVQGDERDHIVISTTYGPNPHGKFYRRFGPLAMAGGGRRLNVLVTRARQEVHLVTSIPQSAYRAIEPVPEGATPSGSWLLFAYLRYAEQLEDAYEQQARILEHQDETPPAAMVLPTENPSRFAKALANTLAAQRKVASDVFWGNEGFCVDLALHHPTQREAVTLGALTDFSRFKGPSDAVSWDLYRVGILRWQGWDLHRVWTPTFFRDPQRCVNQLMEDVEQHTS